MASTTTTEFGLGAPDNGSDGGSGNDCGADSAVAGGMGEVSDSAEF
ncbi:MAG: hypothetical protein ABW215_12730 [Kibdelosporangium sp.]